MTASRRLARSHPALPLAGILALAFAAIGLRTAGTDWPLVGLTGAGAVLLLGAAGLAPWPRRTPAALVVLPVACDLVIALLRHAQGGSTSGYSPLAILPVVWAGLAMRRWAVPALTLCTAALFGAPLVLAGGPTYPSTGWRGAVLWTVVAAVVGTGASRVTAAHRRQTRAASARARELRHLVATQNAIATAGFELETVMAAVAGEALALTYADGAVVELPEGDELVYRAVAGTAAPHLGLRLQQAGSISGLALRERTLLACDDSAHDPRVDADAAQRIGARSMIVVPLVHAGRANGVLKVYSATPGAFQESQAHVLELLASMVGAALDRAELLQRLQDEAVTDELTGLFNRRAWHQHLDVALARAARSGEPLSVIVLDVDGLKQVNDRDGHAAGDRLLRAAAASWRAELRDGDVLGRIGGDEFAILAESADEAGVVELLARLDAALAGRAGASAGVATWDGLEDASSLLSRADASMYSRKRLRASLR